MNELLKNMLVAYQVTNNTAWLNAVQAGTFYITAEVTMIGQYAMGSTEFKIGEKTIAAPCVHPDIESARKELAEEEQDWNERLEENNAELRQQWLDDGNSIDDFEEDEDEFPYEVFLMKWDGGDNVAIYSECGQFLNDDSHTWQWHCGIS